MGEIEITESPNWPTNQITDIYADIGKSNFKRIFHFGPLSAMFITFTVRFF